MFEIVYRACLITYQICENYILINKIDKDSSLYTCHDAALCLVGVLLLIIAECGCTLLFAHILLAQYGNL